MSELSQSHAQPRSESQSDADPAADEETDAGAGWSSDHPIAHEQQMVFGDDGDLEPDDDSVEMSLGAFGADIDHSKEATQLAEPAATRFGVDDRQQASQRNKSTSRNKTEGDQRSLFADVENDQQTLGGQNAATRCLFDSSDTNRDSSNGGDEKS